MPQPIALDLPLRVDHALRVFAKPLNVAIIHHITLRPHEASITAMAKRFNTNLTRVTNSINQLRELGIVYEDPQRPMVKGKSPQGWSVNHQRLDHLLNALSRYVMEP